ncbi:MAG: hypothetical protein JSS83_04280 [Cyanobacteria bacterium SZAS LIN-3]|nr:hypothetical protein [Cyanobacteria bacterium SZAS LIN-3]MBS2008987.1 hypothetical protein [Cyanobacteria bacterium SZAS TMP-1]
MPINNNHSRARRATLLLLIWQLCGSAAYALDSQGGSSAALSKEPNSQTAAPGQKPITAGSDFKTGPVTDDETLIKPVTRDKHNANGSKPEANGRTEGNVDVSVGSQGPISIGALKVAEQLEIVPFITRLDELKHKHIYSASEPTQRIEVLSVRQDLNEAILGAVLQTKRVESELNRQISGYEAVANVLEENRDQAIRNNNILNFTSGGALAMTAGGISVGTSMKYQNAGNELAAIAGGLSALISAYALKLQKGARVDAEADPNMLAPIFGLVPAEPNKYPPAMWKYLNDHEPDQKLSRRQQLIDKWIKLKYIAPLDKSSSRHELQSLSGTIELKKKVTIDMLRNRIPMLEDVRTTIAGMNEYLDEILTFVRKA